MSHTPHFRAGVGCVIYTEENQLVVFRRSDEVDSWQFPQGGIDEGETPEQAIWRELYEETALSQSDFSETAAYPQWTLYVYPPEITVVRNHAYILGQVQRWWFLKVKPTTVIDVSKATDRELSDWKLTSPQDFLNTNKTEWKQDVYQQLASYLTENILSNR